MPTAIETAYLNAGGVLPTNEASPLSPKGEVVLKALSAGIDLARRNDSDNIEIPQSIKNSSSEKLRGMISYRERSHDQTLRDEADALKVVLEARAGSQKKVSPKPSTIPTNSSQEAKQESSLTKNLTPEDKADEILSGSKSGINWKKVAVDFDEETKNIAFERGKLNIETPTPLVQEKVTDEDSNQSDPKKGIPFMITIGLRKDLKGFGVTDEEINQLTPQEAWVLLHKKKIKERAKETLIIKAEEVPASIVQENKGASSLNEFNNIQDARLLKIGELGPFDKKIALLPTVADICAFLISKEYKKAPFGVGENKITGQALAEKISENIWGAKVGVKIDTSLFIPEPAIAQRVEEILRNSIEWTEGVTEFGTPIFEKIERKVKNEDSKKAIDATVQKIAETNPMVWKNLKNWAWIENTGARNPFWAGLLTALLGLSAYTAINSEKNIPNVKTPDVASAAGALNNQESGQSPKKVSETASKNEDLGNNKPVTFIDPTTGYKVEIKPTQTQTPAPMPMSGTPTKEEENVSPITNIAVSGVPAPAETNVTPVDTPDYVSPKTQEVRNENSPDQLFFTAQPEKTIPAQEKPSEFKSVTQMRNWFSQDKQKLAAFERVLHYADGQEEKSANGQPNIRAFWWETMQIQKVSTMLPNKASSENRDLTREYRNYHMRESENRNSIVELLGLDDNQFMTTGAKLREFDAWYKNSLSPATQQLEQKITREEKEVLADSTQTLGEYLTQLVYLGEKYGVEIKGIPTLTEAQQQKVLDFQPTLPILTKQEVTPERNTFYRNIENTKETESVYRIKGALDNARIDWVTDGRLAREWANGPFNEMITEYRRISRGLSAEKMGYSREELQIMRGAFVELRNRLISLGDIYGRQNFELTQVDHVLTDIDARNSGFEIPHQ